MTQPVLGGKLLRSTSAATVSQVWRMGVTFGTQMILRRWIAPDDWGLWLWAVDFLFLMLGQLRDLGLPAHVVRDPERPYGAMLAVQLVWGGVLCVLVFAAGSWWEHLAPEATGVTFSVVALIQALTLFFFFEGLGKVPLTYYEAEIRIDQVLGPEVARNMTFASVAIALAWADFGMVSLLVGHVAGSAVFAALVWLRAYREMPLAWPRGGFGRLLRPSLPLMLMAGLVLAVESADYQVMALVADARTLGFYTGALTLATLVLRALEWPLRRALYPTFVAVRDNSERFFETYRLATVLLMSIHVPVAGVFLSNASQIPKMVWGPDYVAAGPFLALLGLVPLVQPFSRCAEDVLLPRHEEWILTVASMINLLALVGMGTWLASRLGPVGVAWAKLLPIGSLIVAWAIFRVNPRGFGRLALDLIKIYAIAGVFFSAAWWGTGEPGWWRLAASTVAAGLSLLVYVGLYGKAFLEFFRAEQTLIQHR